MKKLLQRVISRAIIFPLGAMPLAGLTVTGEALAQDRSGGPSDTKVAPDLSRASKVIGTDVVNAQGKKIGDIEDVVLDRTRGQVAYAVVSFGGVMGVGSKYFAIPWKSLQAGVNDKYVLNVDPEKLKRAQGFDKDHWPDMASQQWNRETYRYYNQIPYWQEMQETAARRDRNKSSSSGSSSGESGKDEMKHGSHSSGSE